MLFGSRIKVGRVILLRSAPGRSCEMIDINTVRNHPVGKQNRPSRISGL